MKCTESCNELNVECPIKKCRYWIDFPKDLNCTLIAVSKNKRGMVLEDVGKRIHVTAARIKQVEIEAIKKMSVNPKVLKILQ